MKTRRARAILSAFAVVASSLTIATAGAGTANAQAHPCPQDDGQRIPLGTPVNIWDHQNNGAPWNGVDTSAGLLYLGYIPKCRQVYAEAHLNQMGSVNISKATVYLADERGNSEGRVTFTNSGSSIGTWLTSGFVSIDVPEYDAGSQYAAPKAFRAALDYSEYLGCSTILTSGTHQFSDGANFNNGNGATCSHG
ncbi:hypothetical protein AB0G73_34545 [Streptomyces sp. NPDC020719]|uniref:hypothetical protein n=1 Tax=Streptomyces sp. NPDC020719 TaxID=3154896 RepID=UPI0033CCBB7E